MELILLPVLATSDLTDHASRDNHLINWSQATILDRESDRGTRWIKEAVHIRKEGRSSMNRNEGSYTLSHTYNRFLATSPLPWQEPEKELVPFSSDEGL